MRQTIISRTGFQISVLLLGIITVTCALLKIEVPWQSLFLKETIDPEILYLPLFICVGFALFLTTLFKPNSTFFRAMVYLGLLLVAMRYLLWRLTATLNLDDELNAVLSVVLLLSELLMIVSSCFGNMLMEIWKTDRSPEADHSQQLVETSEYLPMVDVLVPTYSEPLPILQRTILGCQALDYPNFNLYVLDDGNRPELKALCEQLNCHYMARGENKHYKAGNINYALARTHSELIAFFDADFVPTRNFLKRTVGFFQQSEIALVQTPQHFYNSDPIETNLGLKGILTNEQELFFRSIEPSRDALNAVICCGTSYVARREALEAIGGIPTESITEDFLTSIALQSQGWRVIYLNEVLSAGDAPATIDVFINQRIRWCVGTIQMLFCKINPFRQANLTLSQRYYHFLAILYWNLSWCRLIAVLMPLSYLMFGMIPLKAQMDEIIFYFLPYYMTFTLVTNWLNGEKRSPFWTDLYETITMVPFTLAVIKTYQSPRGIPFKVTPKLTSVNNTHFQMDIAFPLCVILGLYMMGFVVQIKNWFWQLDNTPSIINLIWACYNSVLLWLGILASIDVPQSRFFVRFPKNLPGQLLLKADKTAAEATMALTGKTHDISEGGMGLTVPVALQKWPEKRDGLLTLPALEFREIPVSAYIKSQGDNQTLVGLEYEGLTIEEHRRLVEYLYCEPGQWTDTIHPEHRYFWHFLKSIFRLYPLTSFQQQAPGRGQQPKEMEVASK